MDFQPLIRALSQQLDHQLSLSERAAAIVNGYYHPTTLPVTGVGFEGFSEEFKHQIEPLLSGSNGPRYWGFVTGGANPTATYADWLVTSLNQNVSKGGDSAASSIEQLTLSWLVELFDLPAQFKGVFTTGATAANVLGALTARQYAGVQVDIHVAHDGFSGVPVKVLSSTPHASMVKALGLAGFGQKQWQTVNRLPHSEAMDVADLRVQFAALRVQNPKTIPIVIASAGTVTGTDFDDLTAIAELCAEFGAWLHVDAAFGIFERLLSGVNGKTKGLELADSITLDCHKWLNVPYDCGVFLTRHQNYLYDTCHVDAPYLAGDGDDIAFLSLGIENSRRFRALPAFATLMSYGKTGIIEQISRNVLLAKQLANWLAASEHYDLVKPCELNVVLFKPKGATDAKTHTVREKINASGKVFMTPGSWQGQVVIRAALSNWSTTAADIDTAIAVLANCATQQA